MWCREMEILARARKGGRDTACNQLITVGIVRRLRIGYPFVCTPLAGCSRAELPRTLNVSSRRRWRRSRRRSRRRRRRRHIPQRFESRRAGAI